MGFKILSLILFLCKWSAATLIITSFLHLLMTALLGNSQMFILKIQVQSLIYEFFSSEKAYSSFPHVKNLELFYMYQ